jgi:hypothetical protein
LNLRFEFGIYLGFVIWSLEFQPCLVPAAPGLGLLLDQIDLDQDLVFLCDG